MKTECLRVIEPNAAPANIATTAAILRCKRGLVPRARDESAARRVDQNLRAPHCWAVLEIDPIAYPFQLRVRKRSNRSRDSRVPCRPRSIGAAYERRNA